MVVWRTWIFPILRIIVIGAVAVALTKLAFFPDAPPPPPSVDPTGGIVEPIITVEKGNVVNNIVLTGSVEADPSRPARATLAGDVLSVSVAQGQQVNEGETLAVIRQAIEAAPSLDPEAPPAPTQYRTAAVLAPITGVVRSVDALQEQQVSVGDTIAAVSPSSFSVRASLKPEDLYRLQDKPSEASVTVTGGPADFTCTDLEIRTEDPTPDSTPTPNPDGGEGASGGPSLRCSVPGDTTVFAGLGATITLDGSSAEDVLVLPVTAVKGSAEKGVVFVPDESEQPVETPVTLGLSDGQYIEITGGVDEGASVFEFIPVDDPSNTGGGGEGDGCHTEPDGTVICAEGGMSDPAFGG